MNLSKSVRVGLSLLSMFVCVTLFQNCETKPFVMKQLGEADLSSTSGEVIQPAPVLPISGQQPSADPTKLITDSIFAPTSFWYTPIPENAPLHANSANMALDFVRQRNTFYNSVAANTTNYTSPVFYVPADTPVIKVMQWDCQNKGYLDRTLAVMWAQVPVPANASASNGTDMEMSIYQASTDTLWEFWKMRKNSTTGNWEGCWGGRLQNVSKTQGQFPGYYGTTATSLPFVGGQITAEELSRGEIRHAIGVAMVELAAWNVVSWPANRSDGNGRGIIPEGLRFRLDPTINVDALNIHPVAKMVAKAGQKYGFVIWDTAGAVSVRFQNVVSYTSLGLPNPYTKLFNGTASYAVLNGIPWDKLQFLPMHYGKPLP